MTLAEELKSRNFSKFMNVVSSGKRASLTASLSRYIRTMVSATSPSPPVRVYWKKNHQIEEEDACARGTRCTSSSGVHSWGTWLPSAGKSARRSMLMEQWTASI